MEQQPTPSPKQAFDLLAQVAVQYRGTRAEHELIEKALGVLAPLVEPPKPTGGG